MDGGRGGVKSEESGPASSWFFFFTFIFYDQAQSN